MINLSEDLKRKALEYLKVYKDNQFVKIAEETSELNQVCIKIYNMKLNEDMKIFEYTQKYKEKLHNNLIEEIGDTLFMIYQIMILKGITQEQIEDVLKGKHLEEEKG